MSARNMNPHYTTSQFKPLSWTDSRKAACVLILGYLVMAVFPAILVRFLRPDTGEALFTKIGRFSLIYHPVREFLFIGGGVRITPIISMLRYLRDTRDPRSVLFLYRNKTEGDIIFRKELENLPNHMKVIFGFFSL